MKKIRMMVATLLVAIIACGVLLTEGKQVKAANNPDALALGFAVDTSKYNNFSKICEKTNKSYVLDEAGIVRICGTVTVQSLFATSKEKYLINNQQDIWLTRIITCGSITKYIRLQSDIVDDLINVQFGTNSVEESEYMPNGVSLASYIATSPSQMVNKTITSGWNYVGSAGYNGKYISIGAETGVSWSSTTKKLLCSAYNESRTTRFKVKFSLLDPFFESMTEKEKSFCYGTNKFHTAKLVYGTPEVMARVQETINVTVMFKGNYLKCGRRKIQTISVYGSTQMSVMNRNY